MLLGDRGSGWWQAATPTEDEAPYGPGTFWEDLAEYLGLGGWYNQTTLTAREHLARWSLGGWEGVLDNLHSGFGWLIFGQSWSSVQTGRSLLIRSVALMTLCLVAHYVLSLAWPLRRRSCGS